MFIPKVPRLTFGRIPHLVALFAGLWHDKPTLQLRMASQLFQHPGVGAKTFQTCRIPGHKVENAFYDEAFPVQPQRRMQISGSAISSPETNARKLPRCACKALRRHHG